MGDDWSNANTLQQEKYELQIELDTTRERIEELERQLDLAQQANRRLIQQLANQDKTNDPSHS